MKVKITGSVEDKFKITFNLDRDSDDYFFVYRNTKTGRIDYQVSKSHNGVFSLIFTLFHKVPYFRQMFTYLVHTTINDLLKIHVDVGMENIKRICELKNKEKNKEKEKENVDGNG